MNTFRCKACNKKLNKDDKFCPDCGSKKIIQISRRIIFCHPEVKHQLSVHKTLILGRNHFRLYGNNYKFLSPKQFQIIQTDSGWQIKGLQAPNPTLLNNNDITEKTVDLQEGDVIKIGNFEIQVKFIEQKIDIEY